MKSRPRACGNNRPHGSNNSRSVCTPVKRFPSSINERGSCSGGNIESENIILLASAREDGDSRLEYFRKAQRSDRRAGYAVCNPSASSPLRSSKGSPQSLPVVTILYRVEILFVRAR